MIADLKNNHH